jgi:hypothetical protein
VGTLDADDDSSGDAPRGDSGAIVGRAAVSAGMVDVVVVLVLRATHEANHTTARAHQTHAAAVLMLVLLLTRPLGVVGTRRTVGGDSASGGRDIEADVSVA